VTVGKSFPDAANTGEGRKAAQREGTPDENALCDMVAHREMWETIKKPGFNPVRADSPLRNRDELLKKVLFQSI